MRLLVLLLFLALPAGAQEWTPWRVLGPFEHTIGGKLTHPLADQWSALSVDGAGPEERHYAGKLGARIEWSSLLGAVGTDSDVDVGHVDLNVAFPVPTELIGQTWNQQHVVFLHRTVHCAEARDLELIVGSDDGVFVWWNGELVHENDVPRGLAMDPPIAVRLERGTNHLLVGVTQAGGGWAFRVTTPTEFSDQAVNDAIDRGVQWLLDQQLVDGSFGHHEDFGGGNAAFGAYVLMRCGLAPDHPAIRRALAWAQARPTTYTYSVACEVLALCAQQEYADRKWLQERVKALLELQESSGLYNYPVYPDGTPRPDDLSATVFAALALHAAQKRDVAVPVKTWKELVNGTLRCRWPSETVTGPDGSQREIAGFTYRPGAGPATGSMTASGISVLTLAEDAVGRKLSKRVRDEIEEAREQAIAWIDHHFTLGSNPGGGHHYYFIYGIERVGSLLGIEQLGGQDWYRAGASYLLDQQEASGAWPGATVFENTPLALLFLRRATRPSSGRRTTAKSWQLTGSETPVRMRAQGDQPLTVFLDGYSDRVIEQHGWSEDGYSGLRVERVEYRARLAGAAETETHVVAVVEGDATEVNQDERFAARIELPQNGAWLLSARIVVQPPPGAVETQILSDELRIVLDSRLDPITLTYAHDEERNELVGGTLECEASSSAGVGFEPLRAFDATQATRWLCLASDDAPWVRLRAKRPVSAAEVLISHAYPRGAERDVPRVARVRIIVNGKDREALEHDLELEPTRKTRVSLGGNQRVRSLEVQVRALTTGAPGGHPVGFAEIELVR